MRNLLTALAFGAAAVATPAMAGTNDNFTGLRIEATAGVDDVTGVQDTTDVAYGAAIGVDVPVGDRFTVGVDANTMNVFADERQIGVAGRLGYAFNDNLLGFARAGYNNYRDVANRSLDGLVVGGGLEYAVSDMTFVKAEYRYSDFENGVGNHGALVGVGIRF